MGVRIETVELDDRNVAHATSRVSAAEIRQVFENGPELRRNRSGRTADFVAIGVTMAVHECELTSSTTLGHAPPVR
ncbi:MAG: hypothetical protein M3291_01460 [Actinomycetota bacterium]|nr:hypothetical protein [Actinomycetota bacterium]